MMKRSFSPVPFIIDINMLNQRDHLSSSFKGLGNRKIKIKRCATQARSAVAKPSMEFRKDFARKLCLLIL